MKSPKDLLPNLLPEERQILDVKYKSIQFAEMDKEEIDLWADALLLKIHAITGWTIPEKTILFVFTDQLKKKICESYSRCNPDEIEYAFRNFGTMVKDWGKSMNLSLIDEVMIPYLQKRFEISKLEEQKKPKMIQQKKELTEAEMQEWWNTTVLDVKANILTAGMLPVDLYTWKQKRGEIKASIEVRDAYLQKSGGDRDGAKRLFIYDLMKNDND